MFRVDSTTWINPKAVGINAIEIGETHNCGDKVYCVHIESEVADYDSDNFPTFEEAEAYVQKLIDQLK